MGNLAELATLLGLGGLLGVLAGLAAAGKRFASRLAALSALADRVAKDPLHADLVAFARQAQEVRKDAESLLGMIHQVVKG